MLCQSVRLFSRQIPTMAVSKNASRIAAVTHMLSTADKEENLEQVRSLARQAKAQNVQLIFYPECCDFVGENRYQTIELAETLSGPIVSAYKEIARTESVWLSMGGVHEAIYDKDGNKTNKIFNTHLIINARGEIVQLYRKLHMFNVDTPEFKYRESEIAEAGKTIVEPVETPIGRIGLQICYDLRFPEVSTHLRQRGAEILTYPSAFSVSTGAAHWEVLLRSRAIENQCFVIAAAQNGKHNKKRSSYGHAIIVDAWGKVIAQCDQGKPVDLAVVEVDPDGEKFQQVRKNMPCFQHRRSDVYKIDVRRWIDVPVAEDFLFGKHLVPRETVFYESALSYAFTNIRCVVPGHVLVATKRKITMIDEMTEEETRDFFEVVFKVEKATYKLYGATSSTVTVQNGPDAGQTVKHVHCHIMPRKKDDFPHNDMIYIELNKHDNPAEELAAQRSLEERIAEAEVLRKAIRDLL